MPAYDDILWATTSSATLARIAPTTTLVLPIGATEQHGPHLPVGVDALLAEQIARRAATRANTIERPILVAPTLAYGSSHHHLPLAGTLSLSSVTLHAVLLDVLESAARAGFRRFLILNGHGGNDDVARQAARDVTTTQDVVAAAAGYWSLTPDRVAKIATAAGIGQIPGHAGAFETSLMLALLPDLVAPELPVGVTDELAGRPLSRVVIEQHGWVTSLPGGFTDTPAAADAAAGAAIIELLVDSCAQLLQTLSTRKVNP